MLLLLGAAHCDLAIMYEADTASVAGGCFAVTTTYKAAVSSVAEARVYMFWKNDVQDASRLLVEVVDWFAHKLLTSHSCLGHLLLQALPPQHSAAPTYKDALGL